MDSDVSDERLRLNYRTNFHYLVFRSDIGPARVDSDVSDERHQQPVKKKTVSQFIEKKLGFYKIGTIRI